MATCAVEYCMDDKIAVLKMIKGDNRFNLEFMSEFVGCLEEVESNPTVKVLITTGQGKFYSNGLDLDKIAGYSQDQLTEYLTKLRRLYQKLLTFSKPTIALMNGHAYAAGGILALAHDYRIMREERGWFCLPEIQLRRRFGFLLDFIKSKVPQSEHIDCIVMGKRYTAKEALEAKIITHTSPASHLMDKAIELSKKLIQQNFDSETLGNLKMDLYVKEYESLGTVEAKL